MDRQPKDHEGAIWGLVAFVGALAAVVACCAIPALVATIGIGAIGAIIGRFAGLGWPPALAVAIMLGAPIYWGLRLRKRRSPGSLIPGRRARR